MRIEFPNPFKAPGRWFKGNLHTHTTQSDGAHTPQEIVDRYAQNGYDFLAITDHGKLTPLDDLDPRGMLLIPGEEVGVGRGELGSSFHLVLLGIQRPISAKSPQAVIDEAREQGGEVVLCHPYWSLLTLSDLLSIDGYIAIEVFNSTCHHSIGKGFSSVHWDGLLAAGRRVWGVAVDDAHHHFNDHRPDDVCVAWISVKAEELSLEAILESMRRGLFYSSFGPEIIDLSVEGGVIHVKTTPVKHITFASGAGRGERWTAIETETITEAHHAIREGERFIRVECMDREGRWAWTNPILITD